MENEKGDLTEPKFPGLPADYEQFQALFAEESAILTKSTDNREGHREFLLSVPEATSDNRMKRRRIRKRIQRGFLDLRLLGRYLSPDEFHDLMSNESTLPDGFEKKDLQRGLVAAIMFLAEWNESKGVLEGWLEQALKAAQARRGREVESLKVEIDVSWGEDW